MLKQSRPVSASLISAFARSLTRYNTPVPRASSRASTRAYQVDVLPGLKAGASTPPDGSAVAPAGPRPFLPALNGGAPRAFLVDVGPAGRLRHGHCRRVCGRAASLLPQPLSA